MTLSKNNKKKKKEDVLLLSVHLRHARQARKQLLLGSQRLAQDHEQATNDREVSEEEREIKDEAVAKGLGNDDTEETSDRLLDEAARDDQSRAGDHDLFVS